MKTDTQESQILWNDRHLGARPGLGNEMKSLQEQVFLTIQTPDFFYMITLVPNYLRH